MVPDRGLKFGHNVFDSLWNRADESDQTIQNFMLPVFLLLHIA